MENHTGSWRLFTGLAVQLCSTLFSLVHSSNADNLKFIKNKPHKDSLKVSLKLAIKKINQMVNSSAYW